MKFMDMSELASDTAFYRQSQPIVSTNGSLQKTPKDRDSATFHQLMGSEHIGVTNLSENAQQDELVSSLEGSLEDGYSVLATAESGDEALIAVDVNENKPESKTDDPVKEEAVNAAILSMLLTGESVPMSLSASIEGKKVDELAMQSVAGLMQRPASVGVSPEKTNEMGQASSERTLSLASLTLALQQNSTVRTEPVATMKTEGGTVSIAGMTPLQSALHTVSVLNESPKVSAAPLTQSVIAESQVSSLPSVAVGSHSVTSSLTPVTHQAGLQPMEIMDKNVMNDVTILKLETKQGEDTFARQLRSVLGERLQIQSNDRVQHATIRLDPPEMGKIEIAMQFVSGKLQVHITASQHDVYRALQQMSQELRTQLTEQNFTQVHVQISSQQQHQQQKQEKGTAQRSDEIVHEAQNLDGSEHDNHRDDSILMTV